MKIKFNEDNKYPVRINSLQEISELKEFIFVPIDTYNADLYIQSKKQEYKLILFGHTELGVKIGIILTGIDVFVDVLVPNEVSESEFHKFIIKILEENSIVYKNIVTDKKKWYKAYNDVRTYKRIYFDTSKNRKLFMDATINKVYSKEVVSKDDSNIDEKSKKYKVILCNNDNSSTYEHKVGRDYPHISYSYPCRVKNYKIFDTSKSNYNKFNIPMIIVNINDFRYDETINIKEKTVLACWDIETFSTNPGVPKDTDSDAKINAIGLTFYYPGELNKFYSVAITEKDSNLFVKKGGKENETESNDEIKEDKLIKRNNENVPIADLIITCYTEREVVKSFLKILKNMRPDYMFAFNDGNYDWSWIITGVRRYKLYKEIKDIHLFDVYCKNDYDIINRYHFVERPIKLDSSTMFRIKQYDIKGMICCDLLPIFRKIYSRKNYYSLNYFLKKEMLQLKYDLSYEKQREIYVNGNPDEMAEFLYYCLEDGVSCYRLLHKRNIMLDKKEISHRAFVNLKSSYYNADGVKVENLCFHYMNKNNLLFPCNMTYSNGQEEKYGGAVVFDPIKGIYDEPIPALDYGSLYPNCCINDNKSPDKIVTDKQIVKEMMKEGIKFNKIKIEYAGKIIKGWSIDHEGKYENMGAYAQMLLDLFKERLKLKTRKIQFGQLYEYMTIIHKKNHPRINSPIYDDYIPKDIQEVINELYEIRETKNDNNLSERFKELSNIITSFLPYLKSKLSVVEAKDIAMKVFLNTFYGRSGMKSSPLYTLLVAAGITSKGQEMIKYACSLITEKGWTRVYGDTDSMYIRAPSGTYDEIRKQYESGTITRQEYYESMVKLCIKLVKELQVYVNNKLAEKTGYRYLQMTYEETLCKLLLVGKKKYAGIKHEHVPNFRDDFELFLRGLDIVKRGQSTFVKKLGKQVLRKILSIKDGRDPLTIVVETLVVMNIDNYKPEDFVVTHTYRKDKEGAWITPYVKRKQNEGISIVNGQKLYLIHTKKPKRIYNENFEFKEMKSSDGLESLEFVKENNIPINYYKYMSKQLLTQLARFICFYPQFKCIDQSLTDKEIDATEVNNAREYLLQFIEKYKLIENSGVSFNKVKTLAKKSAQNIKDYINKFNCENITYPINSAWVKKLASYEIYNLFYGRDGFYKKLELEYSDELEDLKCIKIDEIDHEAFTAKIRNKLRETLDLDHITKKETDELLATFDIMKLDLEECKILSMIKRRNFIKHMLKTINYCKEYMLKYLQEKDLTDKRFMIKNEKDTKGLINIINFDEVELDII